MTVAVERQTETEPAAPLGGAPSNGASSGTPLSGAQFSLRDLFKLISVAAVLMFLLALWGATSYFVAWLAQVTTSLLVLQLLACGFLKRSKPAEAAPVARPADNKESTAT